MVVPIVSPAGGPWIEKAKPITLVLEAGVSAFCHEREAANPEPMISPEVSPEPLVGNAISVISATLLPGAVIRLPVACAVLLPDSLLCASLLRRTLQISVAPPLLRLLSLRAVCLRPIPLLLSVPSLNVLLLGSALSLPGLLGPLLLLLSMLLLWIGSLLRALSLGMILLFARMLLHCK